MSTISYTIILPVKVDALIQEKLEPDLSLEKEVGRNWFEVALKRYKFNHHLVEAKLLESFTQEEVCAWLKRYTHPGEDFRKLSIKVCTQWSLQ